MRRTAEHGPQKRFAAQVIKRFESAVQDFAGNAATIQRDALLGELAKLAQCWQAHNASELAKATDDLFSLFQRAFRDVAPEMTSSARSAAIAPQARPDMYRICHRTRLPLSLLLQPLQSRRSPLKTTTIKHGATPC